MEFKQWYDVYTRWEMKWSFIHAEIKWLQNTPSHHFGSSPKLTQPPYLQVNVTLFVVPECVWVEKGFAAGGTHQPHFQVHLAHMHTDGDTWGWWTLFAALNIAPIHPLDTPKLNAKGLHVGRDCLSWSWKDSWRGRLNCLVCRIRDFRSCRLLRGQMGDGSWWGMANFLVGRWGWRYGGVWHCPPQKPIKTLSLWACHCHFHFPQPISLQVLSFSFQPVGLLPQGTSLFQQAQPLKDKRKEKYRGRNIKGNRKPYGWQAEKIERKPTSSNSPHASSSGWAGKPPICIQLWSMSMSSSSFVWGMETSSSADSSAKKRNKGLSWVMICWKKIYTYKLITREMRGMGGVLPELCAVAYPLVPTTDSPSGSSSSTSTISLSFAHLADVNML